MKEITLVRCAMIFLFIVFSTCSALAIYGNYRQEKKTYAEKQLIYERGYLQACKDMHKGDKLKFELIENSDGTREWIRVENLNAWDDKNYFDKAMLTCPKCGSIRIIGNVPRDRGVITAFKCLDCGYCWERK